MWKETTPVELERRVNEEPGEVVRSERWLQLWKALEKPVEKPFPNSDQSVSILLLLNVHFSM